MSAVIEIKEISVKTVERNILSEVSLGVEKGRSYGLAGANGSGKTTLLKILSGLVHISSGSIWREKGLSIGYYFGNDNLFSDLSGEEHLYYYSKIKGVPVDENKKLLERLELYKDRKKLVRRYSAGMKQRLGVGIALLGEPDVLILDEPMSAIDVSGDEIIFGMLKEAVSTYQPAILMVNHNLEQLYRIVDEFVLLREGRIDQRIIKEELNQRMNYSKDMAVKYLTDYIGEETIDEN